MADFDVQGAKAAGYSDAEIADHLAASRSFDIGAARKSGYSDSEIVQHLAPPAPPSFKDKANQAIRDVVGGAASKLNPIEIGKGMVQSAQAAYEDPIGTLLETFAHPYMALKRAKESYDASKESASKGDAEAARTHADQAAAHLSSALQPVGMTEASEVKMATPGERATGLGEMIGTGIQAYLGAKAPELLSAAKAKAAPIVSNPRFAAGAGAATGAALGHATGIPGAGYVGGFIGREVGGALADRMAGAKPPVIPAEPPPLPPVDVQSGQVVQPIANGGILDLKATKAHSQSKWMKI